MPTKDMTVSIHQRMHPLMTLAKKEIIVYWSELNLRRFSMSAAPFQIDLQYTIIPKKNTAEIYTSRVTEAPI